MGANTVADVKSASGPKVCRATAGSNHAANADPPAPMVAVQPAEPSAPLSSSISSTNASGSSSKPPSARGCRAAEQPRASEAVDQVDGHGAGAFGLAGPC